GTDPGQRRTRAGIRSGLPLLVAAGSVGGVEATHSLGGIHGWALELVPAVRKLTWDAGGEGDAERDHDGDAEAGHRGPPRYREAGPDSVAFGETDSYAQQGHARAHDEHEREHLIPLLVSQRAGRPVLKGVALRRRRDRQRAAGDAEHDGGQQTQ